MQDYIWTVLFMKKIRKWLILAALAAILFGAVQTVQQQRELSEKLVRLHVLANSNDEEDQTVKLQVRDAVLREVSELTADCATRAETVDRLRENLEQIRQAANRALRQAGKGQDVTVSLGRERFPTRVYDTFSLPAGEYTSLRVEIGEAAGRNWWCVVFPTLCAAAERDDLQTVAAGAGFSDDQIALITGQDQNYELKFKFLEGLEKLRALFTE